MSKSEESDYSRINLQDSEDEIRKKIKKAKTDSSPIPGTIEELKDRPEALNLLSIYSFVINSTIEKTLNTMKEENFQNLKMIYRML
jgi:tryptophanyl-tRNA synthetase